MSGRSYQSGAQKRKAKKDKDKKNEEFLKKFPKLSNVFQTKEDESEESQMSSALSTTDTVADITEQSENTVDVEDSGESSFHQLSIASTSIDLDIESNDPGLWDIKSKQKSLQAYWVQHGKKTYSLPIVPINNTK